MSETPTEKKVLDILHSQVQEYHSEDLVEERARIKTSLLKRIKEVYSPGVQFSGADVKKIIEATFPNSKEDGTWSTIIDLFTDMVYEDKTITLVHGTTEQNDQFTIPFEKKEAAKLTVGMQSVASELHPDRNEDAYLSLPEFGVFGVFDGVGGESGGQQASQTARNSAMTGVLSLNGLKDQTLDEIKENIKKLLTNANHSVHKDVREELKFTHAGSTGVLAKFINSPDGQTKLVVGNVGDSRVYVYRKERVLEQITLDDSYVNNLLSVEKTPDETEAETKLSNAVRQCASQIGIPSDNIPEAVRNILTAFRGTQKDLLDMQKDFSDIAEIKPDDYVTKILFGLRSVISQNLGGGVVPEVYTTDVFPGDKVLILSDFTDNLTDIQISQILNETQNPQDASVHLTERAREISRQGTIRSKSDDMTAIVVSVDDSTTMPTVEEESVKDIEIPQLDIKQIYGLKLAGIIVHKTEGGATPEGLKALREFAGLVEKANTDEVSIRRIRAGLTALCQRGILTEEEYHSLVGNDFDMYEENTAEIDWSKNIKNINTLDDLNILRSRYLKDTESLYVRTLKDSLTEEQLSLYGNQIDEIVNFIQKPNGSGFRLDYFIDEFQRRMEQDLPDILIPSFVMTELFEVDREFAYKQAQLYMHATPPLVDSFLDIKNPYQDPLNLCRTFRYVANDENRVGFEFPETLRTLIESKYSHNIEFVSILRYATFTPKGAIDVFTFYIKPDAHDLEEFTEAVLGTFSRKVMEEEKLPQVENEPETAVSPESNISTTPSFNPNPFPNPFSQILPLNGAPQPVPINRSPAHSLAPNISVDKPEPRLDGLETKEKEITEEELRHELNVARTSLATARKSHEKDLHKKREVWDRIRYNLKAPKKQFIANKNEESRFSDVLNEAQKRYDGAKENLAARILKEGEVRTRSFFDGSEIVTHQSKIGEFAEEDYLEMQRLGIDKSKLQQTLEKVVDGTLGKWGTLKPWQRYVASSVVLTLGSAVTAPTVGVAALFGAAGWRLTRGVVGSQVAQGVGKMVDGVQRKRTEKIRKEDFDQYGRSITSVSEFLAAETRLNESFKDHEKRRRNDKIRKMAAMLAVSGASTGLLEHFGHNTFDTLTGTSKPKVDEILPKKDLDITDKAKVPDAVKVDTPSPSQTEGHIGTPSTSVEKPEEVGASVTAKASEITPVSVELSERGYIDTIAKLKAQIAEKYAGQERTALPASVKEILDEDPTELAKKWGLYRPDEVEQSASGLKGDHLVVGKSGRVLIDHQKGPDDILEEAKGEVKGYSGDYFDARPKVSEIETNKPTVSLEANPSDEADLQRMLDQDLKQPILASPSSSAVEPWDSNPRLHVAPENVNITTHEALSQDIDTEIHPSPEPMMERPLILTGESVADTQFVPPLNGIAGHIETTVSIRGRGDITEVLYEGALGKKDYAIFFEGQKIASGTHNLLLKGDLPLDDKYILDTTPAGRSVRDAYDQLFTKEHINSPDMLNNLYLFNGTKDSVFLTQTGSRVDMLMYGKKIASASIVDINNGKFDSFVLDGKLKGTTGFWGMAKSPYQVAMEEAQALMKKNAINFPVVPIK